MHRVEQKDALRRREEEAREAAHELELAPDLEVALDLRSVNALARNALAMFAGSPLAPQAGLKLTSAGYSLSKDGCDFIEGVFLFLAVRGCPEEAIPFVAALSAMSGGNSADYFKATDEQIAARLNCSEKTIQRKRKTLVDWSNSTGYAVIQLKEGRFDKATGRNAVTEYRVPVVAGAERLVKWARDNKFWQRHERTAISNAAVAELQEFVDEQSDELPAETVTQARKKKKAKEVERTPAEMQFADQKVKALRVLNELIDKGAELKINVREVWERIADQIERRLDDKGL